MKNLNEMKIELEEMWLDSAMPRRVKSAHNRKRERDYKRKGARREHIHTAV